MNDSRIVIYPKVVEEEKRNIERRADDNHLLITVISATENAKARRRFRQFSGVDCAKMASCSLVFVLGVPSGRNETGEKIEKQKS